MAEWAIVLALAAGIASEFDITIDAEVRPPPLGTGYDSQLGGAYPLPSGVGIVSRDRTASTAAGAYAICYVNAFQTQAEERDWWLAKHPELLLRDAAGALVEDPNWPGEILLDTRGVANLAALAVIVGGWIDDCAGRGFDAVEPDNLDTYSRSGGLISAADNLTLAGLLAVRAHAVGLAIAQKNAAELGTTGRDEAGFDFAIVESCAVWDECAAYAAVYGRAVLAVEYTDTGVDFAAACARFGGTLSLVLRDRALSTPASPGYAFARC